MKQSIILVYTSLIFVLSIIAIRCKCPDKPNSPTCLTNEKWDGAKCTCDEKSIWNGSKCVNLGTDLTSTPHIHLSIGNNCGDWRDSLYFGSITLNSSDNGIALYSKPSTDNLQGAYGYAEFSNYKIGPKLDSFNITLSYLDYHSARGMKGFAMNAAVNKAKDTVWARIYNASCFSCPYELYDYCDKIFVKRK
jgi:hypothetical protein